jgi:hypothetical protein
MNDIDRRCDAYLAWIDNKRRSKEPILAQINTTAAAAGAILGVTGADPKALAIVATAFGFLADSFLNYNSRLLMEIDHSTVQSVVLSRQNKFRKELSSSIDNSAAAIYALRSYLRLCMPMTIETQINTTVKLFERGGVAALEEASENPMVDAKVVDTVVSDRAIRRSSVFGADSNTTILRRFIRPGGVASPENTGKLNDVLKDLRINVGLMRFLSGREFSTQRADVVRELRRRRLL